MENFEFYNPVKVIFGAGEVARTGSEAAKLGRLALVVSYKEAGPLAALLAQIEAQLKAAGLAVATSYNVTANPRMDDVCAGIATAKAAKADVVVGVGGGSAMDAAKLIAAGVLYVGDPRDMLVVRQAGSTARPPSATLPTLMVPTLPATASEMNCIAVATNEKTMEKSYAWDYCLYPKVSIVDPALTCSLPAYQTACGAADAISHAMESYLNAPADTPLQDRMLEGVIGTTIDNVRLVLKDPADVTARGNLQWAATLAWNGWCNAGINAWAPMHQLGHPMSARHGVAHGASLSLVMPHWMRYILPQRTERLVQFAVRVFGIEPKGSPAAVAAAGIDAFEKFLREIGVPTRLAQVKIGPAEAEVLIDDIRKISLNADGKLVGRPAVDIQGVREIFRMAMQ